MSGCMSRCCAVHLRKRGLGLVQHWQTAGQKLLTFVNTSQTHNVTIPRVIA